MDNRQCKDGCAGFHFSFSSLDFGENNARRMKCDKSAVIMENFLLSVSGKKIWSQGHFSIEIKEILYRYTFFLIMNFPMRRLKDIRQRWLRCKKKLFLSSTAAKNHFLSVLIRMRLLSEPKTEVIENVIETFFTEHFFVYIAIDILDNNLDLKRSRKSKLFLLKLIEMQTNTSQKDIRGNKSHLIVKFHLNLEYAISF